MLPSVGLSRSLKYHEICWRRCYSLTRWSQFRFSSHPKNPNCIWFTGCSKTLSFFDRLCICGNLLIQQQWQMVLNGPRWSNQAGPLCRYWCWYISVNVNKREKGGVKTHSSFYMSSMSHLLLLPVLTSFSSSQTPQQIIFLSGFRIPPSSQITPSVFSDFICC